MSTKEKLTGKRLRLYEIIFESDTPQGMLYDIILLVTIVASVGVVALESVPTLPPSFDEWLLLLEWFFTAVFTVDYIARVWVVPNKAKYMFSFFGIVDLLSIASLPGTVLRRNAIADGYP